MLADQAHAPGKRLAAPAGDAGFDERVEDASILDAQTGHHRDAESREQLLDAATTSTPGDLAAEQALSVARHTNTGLAGLATEASDPGAPGRSPGPLGCIGRELRLVDIADDQDLVVVGGDGRSRAVQPLREAAGEPAGELVVGERVGSAVSFHGLHDYTDLEALRSPLPLRPPTTDHPSIRCKTG